jgi:hypothetical protein
MNEADSDRRSRWRGQAGRLEVWYTTLSDPVTGSGVWVHHEMVAPTDGGAPWAHGWIVVFEPGSPPLLRRFGPARWSVPGSGFTCGAVRYDETRAGSVLAGQAGDLTWHLTSTRAGGTLYTFPRWVWQRELLPAAQVVPGPTASFSGTVRVGDRELVLHEAPGADARIYGHGNAERWGWLHADLGDGEACEVVAAVSVRPGLNRLPPLPLVKFRLGSGDWPRDPLLAAPGMRVRLHRDGFEVRGRVGRRRVRIVVDLPETETVEVDYRDPDGADLLCRNSLRASASIELLRGRAVERAWNLDGIAHAEVGGFRA